MSTAEGPDIQEAQYKHHRVLCMGLGYLRGVCLEDLGSWYIAFAWFCFPVCFYDTGVEPQSLSPLARLSATELSPQPYFIWGSILLLLLYCIC